MIFSRHQRQSLISYASHSQSLAMENVAPISLVACFSAFLLSPRQSCGFAAFAGLSGHVDPVKGSRNSHACQSMVYYGHRSILLCCSFWSRLRVFGDSASFGYSSSYPAAYVMDRFLSPSSCIDFAVLFHQTLLLRPLRMQQFPEINAAPELLYHIIPQAQCRQYRLAAHIVTLFFQVHIISRFMR